MKYSKLRTAFLTCILGIVSVSFFKFEYEKWKEPYIELPQIVSESPIIVKICEEPNLPRTPHGAIPFCNYETGGGASGSKVKDKAQSSTLVRKLFMSLPEKYFYVESDSRDKNKYLDRFLEVEDDENGYMEGNGDGAQNRFRMSLFKQANGRTIIGFYVFGEDVQESHFLEYKSKKWRDIGKEVIPQYKKSNIYDFSLSKKMVEVSTYVKINGEYEYRELYNLVWKNNKFVIEAKTKISN
ncbi:MAG TPA: hypothetical protein PKY82_19840 [Pyrinomonadaceae bacterium]|nr:hypothetical protein [Pyrinomonadaceae bacterium]